MYETKVQYCNRFKGIYKYGGLISNIHLLGTVQHICVTSIKANSLANDSLTLTIIQKYRRRKKHNLVLVGSSVIKFTRLAFFKPLCFLKKYIVSSPLVQPLTDT